MGWSDEAAAAEAEASLGSLQSGPYHCHHSGLKYNRGIVKINGHNRSHLLWLKCNWPFLTQ